jgi:DNA mismatch repair protein MutS2
VMAREVELRKEGLTELSRFLSGARRELEALVKELREGGSIDHESIVRTKDFAKSIEQAMEEARTATEEQEAFLGIGGEGLPIMPGMEVFVGSNRRRGVVKRRGKAGSWVVAIGAVTATVAETELSAAPAAKKAAAVDVHISLDADQEMAVFELDLRGMRAEEARQAVERQIDHAVLQGLYQFGIIHGRGDGILQITVREYLSTSSAVEGFEFARPEEGGFGKTHVRLKRS